MDFKTPFLQFTISEGDNIVGVVVLCSVILVVGTISSYWVGFESCKTLYGFNEEVTVTNSATVGKKRHADGN